MKRGLVILLILLNIGLIFAITGYATEGTSISAVNITGLRFIYDSFNGTTSNFSTYNTSVLQNFPSAALEKIAYGKVVFSENINFTQVGGANRIIDFDSYFNISDNLISEDNVELPYMNKSATITLYNLAFSDPQIIKGSSECGDCTLVSYSGGILIFTTSVFEGPYYARETPVSAVCGNGICESGETSDNCAADCAAGGGGGGGGGGDEGVNVSGDVYDFYVVPNFFVVQLQRGQYFQKSLTIVNNGTMDLGINLSVSGINEFMFPQVTGVTVPAGQNQTVRFDIYFSQIQASDVYVGKVHFYNPNVLREAEVVLDLEERFALFDIRADVLKRYINPGGRVRANISIINMGDLRNFDVALEYKILDFDNNEYIIKKEDFAINQTHADIYFLDVHKDMMIGNYLFYSRISVGNISATSYDTFVVENVSFLAWLILIIAVLIVIIFIIVRLIKHRRGPIVAVAKKRKKEEKKKKAKPAVEGMRRKPVSVPKLPDGV